MTKLIYRGATHESDDKKPSDGNADHPIGMVYRGLKYMFRKRERVEKAPSQYRYRGETYTH